LEDGLFKLPREQKKIECGDEEPDSERLSANWRYSELPNVFSRDNTTETYVVQSSFSIGAHLNWRHVY
jgi:hypothetical protein